MFEITTHFVDIYQFQALMVVIERQQSEGIRIELHCSRIFGQNILFKNLDASSVIKLR